jgi:hypothetical protein
MGLPNQTSRGGSYGRSCSFRLVAAAACASAVASLAGTVEASATKTRPLRAHLARTASSLGAAHAAGKFTGRLRLAGKNSSFTWKLTSRHLTGTAVHAGIYFGKAAAPSQLAMLLCNNCSGSAAGYYRGSYVAGRRFVRAILHGRAYLVVQTKRNPRGEVRGRITAIR